jgi:diaphanous 1
VRSCAPIRPSLAGLLRAGEPIAPHLARADAPAAPERHFSAFPLTSHLHTPAVRLVALHPALVVRLACLRVPEVHDEFAWTVFVARGTPVQDVVARVVDELGLTRALPVPGGGNLDYVLEEAWQSGDDESMTPLLPRAPAVVLTCAP